jgi:dephospho-CoA kinase
MTTIAFTGMPGSGKTEAVKIAEKKGIRIVRMGEIIWDEVKKQGLTINDKNVAYIATKMRETQGKDFWAQQTLKKIQDDALIIDGVRSYEEVMIFKKKLENFILVAIHAAPQIRYQRILRRRRRDDAINLTQVKKRDARELTWGIGCVISMADKMFINERSLDDLHIFVENLIEKNMANM